MTNYYHKFLLLIVVSNATPLLSTDSFLQSWINYFSKQAYNSYQYVQSIDWKEQKQQIARTMQENPQASAATGFFATIIGLRAWQMHLRTEREKTIKKNLSPNNRHQQFFEDPIKKAWMMQEQQQQLKEQQLTAKLETLIQARNHEIQDLKKIKQQEEVNLALITKAKIEANLVLIKQANITALMTRRINDSIHDNFKMQLNACNQMTDYMTKEKRTTAPQEIFKNSTKKTDIQEEHNPRKKRIRLALI
ncbi:MAG: hypothetical protein ACXWL5_04140 [Candidatus Chromulinivorax sp.]